MRGTSVSTYITLEIEVEVEGTYYHGSPAITSGSPDNWEPEDPGQIEISSIRAVYPDPYTVGKRVYPEIPMRTMESICGKDFEDVAVDALFAQAKDDDKEDRAEAQILAYELRMED